MFNLENLEVQKQEELVEKIKDGIAGMELRTVGQLEFIASDYIKFGMIAAIGSAVGTGAYLGVRQLIHITKQKLREKKIEQRRQENENLRGD